MANGLTKGYQWVNKGPKGFTISILGNINSSARQSSNPENWAIYRALIWTFEGLDVKIQTISRKPKQ